MSTIEYKKHTSIELLMGSLLTSMLRDQYLVTLSELKVSWKQFVCYSRKVCVLSTFLDLHQWDYIGFVFKTLK